MIVTEMIRMLAVLMVGLFLYVSTAKLKNN